MPPVTVNEPPAGSDAAPCLATATAPQNRVEADRTAAGEDEIEEDPAEQDRCVASVQAGPGTAPGMDQEIGHGHLSGQNEGHLAGEQARREQAAADNFQQGADHQDGRQRVRRARLGAREVQQLHCSVFEEQQGGNDADQAEHLRRPGVQSVH